MARNKQTTEKTKTVLKISSSKKKLIVIFCVAMSLFLILIVRLFYVSVCNGEEYSQKAQKQWTLNTSLRAQRGEIIDRSGNVLASSYTTYQVCVNPRAVTEDNREHVAYLLSTILELDYDTVAAKVAKTEYQQIKIKDQVEKETVELLSAQQFKKGVISFYSDVKRSYREGQLFSQLLGFTNVDGVGQTGLELTYNSMLAGVDGRQIVETDRDNTPIVNGREEYIAPIAGNNLYLTVDTGLQGYLESACEQAATINNATNVQGILMNPSTGEILAIATYPSFDPNNPPRTDATVLLEMSKNRVVTDTYEPGSTFKIVTLAAALDSGTVSLTNTFRCNGYLTVRGERIKCWKSGGHGNQTLTEAAENSCNCAFMSMALNMGTDVFYDYIYKFGFDTATGSGLMGETSGTVTHRKYIVDTDLARIGFGQSVSTTTMQLAAAASAAINGGNLMQPYIIDRVEDVNGNIILQNSPVVVRRVISEQTSEQVRQILQSVVENGSGKNAQVVGYTVGGKTGTAQKYEEDGSVSKSKLIASFVGFAPASNPQYLCIIVVNEPQVPVVYGSTVAAPFVQMVLQNALTYGGVAPDSTKSSRVVPDLTNMSVQDAINALNDVDLKAVYMEDELSAFVTRQSPPAGSLVVKGSTVILYTSWTTARGEDEQIQYVKMPDIIGKNRIDAFDALKKAGLVMDYEILQSQGVVSGTQYAEGTEIPYGSTVWVTFTYTPDD
ncbi:MAG: penicillin-binding transpeptidase domain-containing protein [Eubacteriales bacterium]|nr:penicillin-binding transpeptidase domain-containing protein [Eubacteriales bacterium]